MLWLSTVLPAIDKNTDLKDSSRKETSLYWGRSIKKYLEGLASYVGKGRENKNQLGSKILAMKTWAHTQLL